MLILVTLFFYSILKFKYMVYKEEWELIQQNVVSNLDDLSTAHNLGKPEYQNLSIALQFFPKKAKQTVAGKIQAFR